MKLNLTLVLVAATAAYACIGCTKDTSSDTQQMPASASSKPTSAAGVPTNNLPPQAQAALQNAASKKTTGN